MNSIYLGLISGTSADGVDACAVSFDDKHQPQQHGCLTLAYDPELRQRIFAVQQHPITLDEFGELDTKIGEHFASAALQLIKTLTIDSSSIVAIGSHGQTLQHRPDCSYPYSLQLGNPSLIAERTQITTVAHFRQKDIAAGGQGAPLVPAFHHAWLGHLKNTALLNLGGIANLSLWDHATPPRLEGFDTGPANTLIDAWCSRHLEQAYDDDGQWARRGQIDSTLLANLLKHEYFQQLPPKSTHIDQFSLQWLDQVLACGANVNAQDVAATLVELTAASVQQALQQSSVTVERIIACGGGCRNSLLLERIAQRLGRVELEVCDGYGISADWVEAVAFAWLARQTLGKQIGNVATVTGARHACILGGIFYA